MENTKSMTHQIMQWGSMVFVHLTLYNIYIYLFWIYNITVFHTNIHRTTYSTFERVSKRETISDNNVQLLLFWFYMHFIFLKFKILFSFSTHTNAIRWWFKCILFELFVSTALCDKICFCIVHKYKTYYKLVSRTTKY